MRAPFDPFPDPEDSMLDREALEVPRSLSRADGRAAMGPDWSWTRPQDDEEAFDD